MPLTETRSLHTLPLQVTKITGSEDAGKKATTEVITAVGPVAKAAAAKPGATGESLGHVGVRQRGRERAP